MNNNDLKENEGAGRVSASSGEAVAGASSRCGLRSVDDTESTWALEVLIKRVCPVGGSFDDAGVMLGNVSFWIDANGPWANQLSYSIPVSQWDVKALIDDLTGKLMEVK